jgi:hypothetical protein
MHKATHSVVTRGRRIGSRFPSSFVCLNSEKAFSKAKTEKNIFRIFQFFSRGKSDCAYYSPGLPDFSWFNVPKREKYNQMTLKHTQWPKMCEMAIK